eukprot:7188851-Lingulodinium_polyedra.AAC.1
MCTRNPGPRSHLRGRRHPNPRHVSLIMERGWLQRFLLFAGARAAGLAIKSHGAANGEVPFWTLPRRHWCICGKF